ncbi:MAG: response regulator [Flavobacteriaceae bacterium]
MKINQLISSITLLLTIAFSSIHHVHSQEITKPNYNENFKKVRGFINEEELGKATELTYKLIEFLNENKNQYSKDSINILLTKNYYNLTNVYMFDQFDLSIKYADSTINAALRTQSAGLKQRAYSIKYYCLYDVKGYEKTLDFLADECIKYSKEAENDEMLAESYMHKCNSLVEIGRSIEATEYCDKAVALFKTITRESYLASVYNNIGNVFVKSNEIEKALEYYTESHKISLKIKNIRDIYISARNIAEKNELIKNYKVAAEYYKVYGDTLQSYYLKTLETKFAESEAKFQVQQKDKEIAQQELEIAKGKNTRNIIIIIGLFLAVLIFIVLQQRFIKQKRRKLEAENELQKEQEINELRAKFLGNISHEIRTPLTLISGSVQSAMEGVTHNEKTTNYLKSALRNTKKVIDDANEILHILKFDKKKQDVFFERVTINEFCKRIFLSFDSTAKGKQIDLEFKTTLPKGYQVEIDLEKTERILNNLIVNAIKFSPSQSKIIFEMYTNDEWLEMKVIDFGIGVSHEEKEKIFERFYQSKTTKSVGGIGIGLALSKEFAELMKGSLTVSSVVDEGSVFRLQLPLKELVSIDKQKETPSKKATINKGKAKVLVVEDNVEMSSFLVDMLGDTYECSVAFDGHEAYEKIKNEHFDLITSDVMMPKVDGFELREKVNLLEDKKHIPFILVTAKHLEVDKIKGFNLGIHDYIVKPFNKNELLARISNLIANSKTRKEWQLKDQELFEKNDSFETVLLEKIQKVIIENITNEDFKVDDLAKEVGYSQRQLSRLLKQYTGLSPVKFILELRLQKAYQLLQDKAHYTLSEVKYDIGISSTAYFNTKFKERFGIKPSEFLG